MSCWSYGEMGNVEVWFGFGVMWFDFGILGVVLQFFFSIC